MNAQKGSATGGKQLTGKTEDISIFPWSGMDTDPFSGNVFDWHNIQKANKWAVSWSDLMMTMFIFFAVLYAFQTGNQKLKFGTEPGNNYLSHQETGQVLDMNTRKQPSDIYNQVKFAIKNEFVDSSTSVELTPDKAVRIVLAGDLMFDLGRVDLKPKARWRLREIAKILKNNSFAINITGHTDNLPNHSKAYPSNWELSTARACAVTRYLIGQGVNENRFFVSGYSWHHPIVPNTTAYNRSLNRRVEIILMKEIPYAKG